MVKRVTVIEASVGEGSGYCGCGSEMKSLWDEAKIANMALERDEICLEKDKYETEIFGNRLGIIGSVVGREREGFTILEVC